MPYKGSKMIIPAAMNLFRKNDSASVFQSVPKKILLVKQSERMGNILLMKAAITGLGNEFPNARIDLMLPAAYCSLMADESAITTIIPVEKRKYITRPWEIIPLLSKIRKEKYDIAINCSDVNSHSSTEASYTILSGAAVTAGWKSANNGLFNIEIDPYDQVIHATRMYTVLFSSIFGRMIEPVYPEVYLPDLNTEPAIGINCGGRGTKRIPLDLLIEMGKRFTASGIRVEFILGPDEYHLRTVLKDQLSDNCLLLPPLKLEDLRDAIKRYRAFISSDTGPMHLAWTMGIPTVAIFADSEIEKFQPLSAGSLVIDASKGIYHDRICDHIFGLLNMERVSS